MRPTRTLALRRETLTSLDGDALAAVAGGSHLCESLLCAGSGACGASFDTPCPTLPLNPCFSLPPCR